METLIWAKITKIGDILRYIPTIVETPIWVPLNLTFFNAPTSQGCPQSCALPPTGSWFNELAWTWAGPTRRSKDIQKSTVFSWPRYQRTHLYTSIYIYQTISIDDRWIDVKWRERERGRERAWLDCILQTTEIDMQTTVVSVIETTLPSQNFMIQVTNHLPAAEADMCYGQNMVCKFWSSHHHDGFHTRGI